MKIYELTKCRRCDLMYDARNRSADCPHQPTTPEPPYFANLRRQGPPYKIEPQRATSATSAGENSETEKTA
jgi:rubredoxin